MRSESLLECLRTLGEEMRVIVKDILHQIFCFVEMHFSGVDEVTCFELDVLLHWDWYLLEFTLGLLRKTAVGRVQLGLERIVEGLELDGVVVEELVNLGQVVCGLRGKLCWSWCRRGGFLMWLLWERSGKSWLMANDNLRSLWIWEDFTRLFIELVRMLMLQLLLMSISFMRRNGALQDRRIFIVLDWNIYLMNVFLGDMGVRLFFSHLVLLRFVMFFLWWWFKVSVGDIIISDNSLSNLNVFLNAFLNGNRRFNN